ncbi:MAG: hypothetical protein HY360_04960 [Verrucomicrobia bacterium]|nr:hypothetical protein [Verrucomicrobiota bacterium]
MHPDLQPGKYLMFDNTAVADAFRLRRRIHQPKRDPQSPVLTPDKPWEGKCTQPMRVVFDATEKRYRMWYYVHDPKAEDERKSRQTGLAGNVGAPQPLYVCYAESNDGIDWQRPPLGIFDDHRQSAAGANICFKGHSGAHGTILERCNAPADERYVMATCDWFSTELGGVCLAFSPDGLRWRYKKNEPVIFGHSDTSNCLVYNAERKVYMLYMRGWHAAAVNWPALGKGNPRRRVSYSESADLEHWNEPQIIITPDELDTNDFYGIHVFKYEHLYLGQLWVYDDDDRATIHVELAFSHDGFHWSRLPERPIFIPHGDPGDPDGYMVFPAQAPVIVGDDIYVYYTGVGAPHNLCRNAPVIAYRGRLRMDGFLSIGADHRPGALITRPFILQNDRVTINAAAHQGEIVAELCEPYYHEAEGKPIEGFGAKDFDGFRGDNIRHPLSWKGNSRLSSLKGKRLMLRMLLTHAEIYSLTI